MPRVLVLSPYAGDNERDAEYYRLCVLDCVRRGETAIEPYRGYDVRAQRLCSEALVHCVRTVVVYADYGRTVRMGTAEMEAHRVGRPVEYRRLFTDEELDTGLDDV